MRWSSKSWQITLCFIHFVLGVTSITVGAASIMVQEASYRDGIFAMGIWLGLLMLILGLSGLLISYQSFNPCRINFFIGFCCVAIVTMLVCCIPIITGPVLHFEFESKVSKDYYKKYGPIKNYYLPQSYYDERNRVGKIGRGVYGTLLGITIVDAFVGSLLCMILKQTLNLSQTNNGQRRQPLSTGALNTGFSHSTQRVPSSPLDVIQDGFFVNEQMPQLPSYADIYPEGNTTMGNQPIRSMSTDPPPAYSDTSTTSDPPPDEGLPPYSEV